MDKGKYISSLIQKHINNNISKDELESLQELLNNNVNDEFTSSLTDLWESTSNISNTITTEELNELYTRIKPRKKINFKKALSQLAAILFIPILISNFLLLKNYKKDTHKNKFISIETPLGSKQKTILSDGSIVWLNSGSKIKYASNYSDNNRTIHLTGEAFFNVKANKKKTFYVITKNGKIIVTGTKFNIDTYNNQEYTQIALESGILEFTNKYNNKTYKIYPGELLFCDKNEIKKTKCEIKKTLAWKNGLLIFENDPLSLVAKKLNRWYDSNIIVSKQLQDHRITITIKQETLEKTLSYIQEIIPIKIIKKENKEFLIIKK